jgi:hypothetical protein
MAKSTGCCLSEVHFPTSGLPATVHHGSSICGTRTPSSWAAGACRADATCQQTAAHNMLTTVENTPLLSLAIGSTLQAIGIGEKRINII